MSTPRAIWPVAAGVVFEVVDEADGTFDVDLDGRRVWSFKGPRVQVPPGVAPPGVPAGRLRFEPWPERLRERLRGTFRVRLRASGAEDGPEVTLRIGDDGPLQLVDRYGRPLVVNKWGRLGCAIADAGSGMVERMLDSMDAVRTLLQGHLGDRVYVTGGTLLGPVREGGHLLPHDDDADLAYLSRFSDPADVALENFELGRLLREAGHEVVRLSVGHLQVLVDHDGVPDHYVDVFTGFLLGEYYYQHFPIRARGVRAEDLLPPVPLQVEGRTEPAPRDFERVLTENYGPGWRTPDPAFTFDVPPDTSQRFYGWFADYNVEREAWEDEIVTAPGEVRAGPGASAFARWVDVMTPAGTPLVELGCGLGTDALALGAAGRTVRAVDYSRSAVQTARAALAGRSVDVAVDVLNLLDTRAVLRLGAETAARPGAWSVFGRRLLNALEDRGRDNVFRLCHMLLRRGGAAHFDLVADHGYRGIAPHRHLTLEQVVREAGRHGLVVDEATRCVEPVTWFDAPDERMTAVWRMTLRRRTS